MNATQKRIKALKNPTKQRIFTAWTGLTFDMNKIPEKRRRWYYPRGAAFEKCLKDMGIDDNDNPNPPTPTPDPPTPEPPVEDDTATIEANLAQNINNNGADFTGDDSGDPTPTVIDVITIQNSDGSQSVLSTSDNRILETKD